MTTYVYKSTTGHPVNIDNFTITPNPGLQLKYPNDILDTYLGTSINRYDDGVLVSSDPESPVIARKTLTGGIELWAGDEPITVGGGSGITPDATGTLAGKSTHDAEAAGFIYLATDQTPAEYYFREGTSGWSPAVEVQGPQGIQGVAGATGPTGPQGVTGATGSQGIQGATGATGAQGATGATGAAGVDGVTFVSGTAAPNNADGRPNGTVYVRYAA